MARKQKATILDLRQLHWDAFVSPFEPPVGATPYMWIIFFKIDGTTVSLNAGGTLSGEATLTFSNGSHGDLGTNSILPGQGVNISSTLGWWSTTLQPIPVDPSLQPLVGDDLPAFFGAVAVAMTWEHVTDSAAEAGHQALNAYVQSAIDQVIASIGPMHQQPTQADIDGVTAGAASAVSNAVENAQSAWQNFKSWFLGADQEIGNNTWLFNQDSFPDSSDHQDINQAISTNVEKWPGAWSIHGALDVTDTCPAGTTLFVLEKHPIEDVSPKRMEQGVTAMRSFRDGGGLRALPTAAWWWEKAAGHTAELAKLMIRDVQLRKDAGSLLAGIGAVLHVPNESIPDQLLGHLSSASAILAQHGSPRLASDARRAAKLLPSLKGKSLHAAEKILREDRMTFGSVGALPKRK